MPLYPLRFDYVPMQRIRWSSSSPSPVAFQRRVFHPELGFVVTIFCLFLVLLPYLFLSVLYIVPITFSSFPVFLSPQAEIHIGFLFYFPPIIHPI